MHRPYADRTNEYLEEVKSNPQNDIGSRLNAIAELEYRRQQENMIKMQSDIQKLTKPHWTLNPTFWLVLATGIFTLISTAILSFQFWQSFSQEKKFDPNTPPVQTNSQGLTPAGMQPKPISQLPNSPEKKRNSAVTKKSP